MLKTIPVGMLQTNCYIAADESTKEAAVIDPAAEFEKIKLYIESNNLKVKYILLTHGHGDHILAVNELREYSKAPVGIHEDDKEMLGDSNLNYSFMYNSKPVEEKCDFTLKDGDVLRLGESELRIIHTPGHTMGSIGILFGKDLMSGDTLFAEGIGRTDLPGGDYRSIMESIEEKLFILPDETVVHPGHGPYTTIGSEKQNNPFF
ncbi:MAG: fold metallo-hydrolase [Clostridia bacterium]|nr:fold metallo-hydrolase [Clostridia bacterium]